MGKKKGKGKKGKKNSKVNRGNNSYANSAYKSSKVKSTKPSVSSKEAEKVIKELRKRDEIPALKAVRKKCNHMLKKSTAIKTVGEMETDLMYSIKYLTEMNEAFGEENVGVCANCLTALPSMEVLTPDVVETSRAAMIGALEHIIMKKSNEKEIKELHKNAEDMIEFLDYICEKYMKYYTKNNQDNIITSKNDAIDYSKYNQ